MANSVDPDQIVAWPRFALFVYPALFAFAILSEILVYEMIGHFAFYSVWSGSTVNTQTRLSE